MLEEPEALVRLKRQDISGLATLVEIYQQDAVRVAVFITRDLQAAEDVVSECFLVVYERIAQFDDHRPFRPWFFRIVANAALKATSRQRRFVSLERAVDEDSMLKVAQKLTLNPAPDPELSATEQADLRTAVQAGLAALTPKQRSVIALRYLAGLNEIETSELLSIPRGTVKSRLAAGASRLRALLTNLRSG